MAQFLVGCDVGTGGTKAVVMASDGAVLGSHFIEYPLITTKTAEDRFPGVKAEQDPEWYWNAAADTIRASIHQSKVDASEIKGVGSSGLSPTCILVDKDLHPLQNAQIWMDRRATSECARLRQEIGEERIFQVSGNVIDPFYGTAKLLWNMNNHPDLYQQTYKFLSAVGYLCMKLSGATVMDYSSASLFGIAFDIVNREWNEELVEAIGLDAAKLPAPFPCDEVIGEVSREAAERTGLAPGTPVVAGAVDSAAAWIASGAVDVGTTQLIMGTSATLGVVHDAPAFTRGMITMIHAAESRRKYVTCGALACGGALIRYLRDNFARLETTHGTASGINAYDILNEEAKPVPVGSDGLIVLPYFMGERTPLWDAHARGVVFGLHLNHGRGHWVRAMMEGVGYAVRHNFELMQASGVKMRFPIVLCEGGARSPLWRQIIADILNVECAFAPSSQGAPAGDAVLAGVGVGILKEYDLLKGRVVYGDNSIPNPANHARYMKLYAVFRSLYPALKNQYVDLAEAISTDVPL
jgi:xylulokinase